MNITFDVALLERPGAVGLSRTELIDLLDCLKEDEVYPLEIEGFDNMAMGFITKKAAEKLRFDYEDSGFASYIHDLLDSDRDIEETEYSFQELSIYLSTDGYKKEQTPSFSK